MVRNAPSVTPLMFADDLIIFTPAKLREIRAVKGILETYSAGQVRKSTL